jgi:hypothetical protein
MHAQAILPGRYSTWGALHKQWGCIVQASGCITYKLTEYVDELYTLEIKVHPMMVLFLED